MQLDEYRSEKLVQGLCSRIAELARALGREVALMEVCGTHTMEIARHGLRALLPDSLRLLSGPGCPVCVTSARELDRAVVVAELPGVTVATFGDMFRVPGSRGSLEEASARGAKVRIIYSPFEAVEAARAEPESEVVLLGVGFETTAPAIAAALRHARATGVGNFSVLPLMKLIPPALRALLAGRDDGAGIDGLLLPGHVSAVLGAAPYEFIPREFGVPCAVTGFEPVDILQGIASLLEQLSRGRAEVANVYRRVVADDGNAHARVVMSEVFSTGDAEWRALGTISSSGLEPAGEYAELDARKKFPLDVPEPEEPAGCLCGRVLTGRALPRECALFGASCTPEKPVGPCMVSSEGACAAHFRYGIE